MRDSLVVHMRDMLQHERLEGAIIDQPNPIAFRICGHIGQGVGAVEPISESFFIYDECQAKAPVFPVRFRSIENKRRRPGIVQYVLHGV